MNANDTKKKWLTALCGATTFGILLGFLISAPHPSDCKTSWTLYCLAKEWQSALAAFIAGAFVYYSVNRATKDIRDQIRHNRQMADREFAYGVAIKCANEIEAMSRLRNAVAFIGNTNFREILSRSNDQIRVKSHIRLLRSPQGLPLVAASLPELPVFIRQAAENLLFMMNDLEQDTNQISTNPVIYRKYTKTLNALLTRLERDTEESMMANKAKYEAQIALVEGIERDLNLIEGTLSHHLPPSSGKDTASSNENPKSD